MSSRLMKKMIFALAVVGAISALAVEAPKDAPRKSLKLLTIGNSFSVSLVRELPKVAKDLGLELDYASACIGGCSLERHWVNYSGQTTDVVKATAQYEYSRYRDGVRVVNCEKDLKEALADEKWDIISIQQVSGKSWQLETFQPWGDKLIKGIRELAPQAEIVVQETWSYTPWDSRLKKWGIDQNQMYDKLHDAYARFAAQYGFRVVPMGTAVQNWRKALPVKYAENSFGGDLAGAMWFELKPEKAFEKDEKTGKWVPYRGKVDEKTGKRKGGVDVFHLNRRGEYFQALVWTAKLFGADVTKATYKPNYVSDSDAVLMRKVVMETETSR